MFYTEKTKKGFTLIEILIVVAIIATLLMAVLLFLSSARDKSKDASFKKSVQSILTASEACCVGGGMLYDKGAGSGSVPYMCSNDAKMIYPGDDNIGTATIKANCGAPKFEMELTPGTNNSGRCTKAFLKGADPIAYEGC